MAAPKRTWKERLAILLCAWRGHTWVTQEDHAFHCLDCPALMTLTKEKT